jgi:hypothetical protein
LSAAEADEDLAAEERYTQVEISDLSRVLRRASISASE